MNARNEMMQSQCNDDDDDDDWSGALDALDARATVPLADPRLEQPAEWPLARGPWEFVGTSAP